MQALDRMEIKAAHSPTRPWEWYEIVTLFFTVAFVLLVATFPFWATRILFGSSGYPGANAEYTIKDSATEISSILASIDKLVPNSVSQRLNMIEQNPETHGKMYEDAWWYSMNGSEVYGVGIVRYHESVVSHSHDYQIAVYSPEKACKLCDAVSDTLDQAKIPFDAFREPVYRSSFSRKYRRTEK